MKYGIYLDNVMTTRPSNLAISNMLTFYTDKWGTSSAPHLMGQQLFPAIEENYRTLYKLLGAENQDSIILTSSGAEAINHVLMSAYYDITMNTGKNQYITTNIDEAPTLMCISRLERLGCLGKMIPVGSDGKVTVEAIAEAITPRTALVSLSWANGITGVIQPVQEIAQLCQQKGVKLHLDATHVLGKLYFDLKELNADFITFNGDHIHAPKGTGALYVKSGANFSSFILGGLEQAGLRAGTLNVPGLVALGTAAQQTIDSLDLVCTETARLRDKFEKSILENVPGSVVFFKDQSRLPHCSAIGFIGLINEALLFLLNRKGVFASIGGGSFQQIGLILMASNVPETLAHSAISFSLSRETTEEEVDKAAKIISECVSHLRKISEQIQAKREI